MTNSLTSYTAPERRVLDAVEGRINGVEAMLGNMPDDARRTYIQSVTSLVRSDTDLLNCTPDSILYALQTAAQFRLAPGPLGLVWFINYGGKLQFQMGLNGVIELARRWDPAIMIKPGKIYKKDHIVLEEGLNEEFQIVRPRDDDEMLLWDRGPIVAYYCVVTTGHGKKTFEVMSKDECHAHGKKYSKSYTNKKGYWQTSPDEACMNTVTKKALKRVGRGDNILGQGMNVDGTTGYGVEVDQNADAGQAANALASSAEHPEPDAEEKVVEEPKKEEKPHTRRDSKPKVEKIPKEDIEDAVTDEPTTPDPVEQEAIRQQEDRENESDPFIT